VDIDNALLRSQLLVAWPFPIVVIVRFSPVNNAFSRFKP